MLSGSLYSGYFDFIAYILRIDMGASLVVRVARFFFVCPCGSLVVWYPSFSRHEWRVWCFLAFQREERVLDVSRTLTVSQILPSL